jgi:predicted nucleic-acid-binding Zn-ribbon protein
MKLPWQARDFERTCADCGYAWRVPRQFVRRRFQSISILTTGAPITRGRALDPRGPRFYRLDSEVQAIETSNQEIEAFRSCPKCSSQRFAQRAVRRDVS